MFIKFMFIITFLITQISPFILFLKNVIFYTKQNVVVEYFRSIS